MDETILKLRQAGESVLRQPTRPLPMDEIHSPKLVGVCNPNQKA